MKLKDLQHNLSLNRSNSLPAEKDLARVQKYLVAYHYLLDIKKDVIQPGTLIGDWMKEYKKDMYRADLLQRYSSSWQNPPARTSGWFPQP